MKSLTEGDVIAIFREEWEHRVQNLLENVGIDVDTQVDGKSKNIITPELKVTHKKSGLRYTVDSVGTEDIILRTPESKKFLVNKHDFESEYEL